MFRMYKALADCHSKSPPAAGEAMAFWNGYNTLAKEYDKEFLRRYDTDLDTCLIFAGLFSAVSSAFIIQIQPEFDSDPHPLSVIAQSLLYISLGSTLLAALLAVLGKQWLMYYSAAGERGSIDTRGFERQRKLDGLRKWRFELIMQAFPLLLQFGLFLFASSLSVYLWKIHRVLAGIVLGMTAVGTIAYLALLMSAIFSEDSPFQTPLAPFFKTIGSRIVPESVKRKGQAFYGKCRQQLLEMQTYIKQLFSSLLSQSSNLLPRFALHQTVCWVLETSTDATLLAQAADMSIDLQWPLDMNLTLDHLIQKFLGCFEYHIGRNQHVLDRVRHGHGMESRATQFGQAYITMQSFLSPQSLISSSIVVSNGLLNILSPELATVLELISNRTSHSTGILSQPWLMRALHIKLKLEPIGFAHNTITYLKHLVAKLDPNSCLTCATFSEYLFVVYFCLVDGNISSHDMRVMDKSAYEMLLYERILKTLPLKLTSKPADMKLNADILKLTLQLANNCKDHREWHEHSLERQVLVYEFCGALPRTDGWIQVICTPGLLSPAVWSNPASYNPEAESWIYNALESIPSPVNEQGEWEEKTVDVFNGLLCAVYNKGLAPPKISLKLLIQLLSLPDSVSSSAAWLMLQENVHDWYTDPEIGLEFRNHSVWSLLCAVILQDHQSIPETHLRCYVDLAYLLSAIPEWQPDIRKELSSWVHIFPAMLTSDQSLEKYNTVFKTIWPSSLRISAHNHLEETAGLVCVALSNFWASFDIATPMDPNSLFAWLDCTNSIINNVDVRKTVQHTETMQESFIPLQNNLLGFVDQIQSLPSPNRTPILTACGEIIRDFATKMLQTEVREKDLYYFQDQIEWMRTTMTTNLSS
ncbi:hypothetical protein R3P38DRAFT_2581166 [Favolaschia claudopus]|uniref:DUF6535 domain-containing protein n=1 Tax=Favolaschia claudopus TaxID=2862362 RepID=A0AAV9ZCE2_9AGAR